MTGPTITAEKLPGEPRFIFMLDCLLGQTERRQRRLICLAEEVGFLEDGEAEMLLGHLGLGEGA